MVIDARFLGIPIIELLFSKCNINSGLICFLGNPVHRTYSYGGFYSATSDDQVFRQLALTYARNHPIMKNGGGCHGVFNFTDGIVNGAHW